MAITHQAQVITLEANADLAEGTFVKLTNGKAANTAGTATAADVVGVVEEGVTKGWGATVVLPGHQGIVQVALHSGASTVGVGTRLYLGASGTVTTGTSGTLVAIALAPGTAGHLVEARLVEPADVAAAEDSGSGGSGGSGAGNQPG